MGKITSVMSQRCSLKVKKKVGDKPVWFRFIADCESIQFPGECHMAGSNHVQPICMGVYMLYAWRLSESALVIHSDAARQLTQLQYTRLPHCHYRPLHPRGQHKMIKASGQVSYTLGCVLTYHTKLDMEYEEERGRGSEEATKD